MRRYVKEKLREVGSWWSEQNRALLPALFAETSPLDLRIVGRMLVHAAAIGAAAGLFGVLFFLGLEWLQKVSLEQLAGYTVLRAHGEVLDDIAPAASYRPWLLALVPAFGGLLAGLVMKLAPETRGGGGDAMIEAFHEEDGYIRPRVIPVKWLASTLTLGTGGSGGREGPTMLTGAALGSLISSIFGVSARERRVLMVAGVAAGIAAVFRTPLGAALIAVEVLYRDGFESEALIPSVFSSVIAFSIVSLVLGDHKLFLHEGRIPFFPSHLPLYVVLALMIAALGVVFLALMRRARKLFKALPIPDWSRPAVGGLALGVFVVAMLALVTPHLAVREGQGLGILGGGYGAAQVAIGGSKWLPAGWAGVELLFMLSIAKIIAATLTIGSGGSAGDFAPSLVIGALFGGAFGRAVELLGVPGVDPGAFALVGMACFYGGVAHVPLSALVIVCELAGNYDLLVPLMLALGVSYVALRKRSLYESQRSSPLESATQRSSRVLDQLRVIRVRDVMTAAGDYVRFRPDTAAEEMLHQIGASTWQDVFPVIDGDGRMIGLVSDEALRLFTRTRKSLAETTAHDVAAPPIAVHADDDVASAARTLLEHELRELPVLDEKEQIVGFLDESDVAAMYLESFVEHGRASLRPGRSDSVATTPAR